MTGLKASSVETGNWTDSLRLNDGGQRPQALFGGEGRSVTTGKTTGSMNDRPSASFVLDSTEAPVDYLAPLQVLSATPSRDEPAQPLFTGMTDSAQLRDGHTRVNALGATELAERVVGGLVPAHADPIELVYMLARAAGMTRDRLVIEGLDDLPVEVFRIVVPVDGLTVDEWVDVNGVRFHHADSTSGLPQLSDLFTPLGCDDAEAYAVTHATARHLYDAEQTGLERISRALDGLLTATLYGLSTRPGGRAVPFRRDAARARPIGRPVVHVQGTASARSWARTTSDGLGPVTTNSTALLRSWPELARATSPSIANGFAALRRAADDRSPVVQRVQALFDAIEFYVAGERGREEVLSKTERKQVRKAVRDTGLNAQQLQRIDQVLENVNNPSLFMRITTCTRRDGVPVSPVEISLLQRLRNQRNDTAHGRASTDNMETDLRWALSVVARLLLHRHATT